MNELRWKQRLDNFDRAYHLLQEAVTSKPLTAYTDLEQEGIAQRFEFTFELAWKTMKDYLDTQGVIISPVTPRNVIKEAFSAGILEDGQTWIDMMLDRNLLAHNYDFSRFQEVLTHLVDRYMPALTALQQWFQRQMDTP